MAWYLAVFWILCSIFFIVYLSSRWLGFQKIVHHLEEHAGLFFIFMGVLLIMAFITHDPIAILGIELPPQVQWLGSLVIFGLSSWQFYLRPLKLQVYTMDRELGEVKVGVNALDKDVCRISHDFGRLSKEVAVLSKDVGVLSNEVGTLTKGMGVISKDVGVLSRDVGALKSHLLPKGM